MSLHDGSIIDLKAEVSRKEDASRKRSSLERNDAKGKKTLEKLSAITGKKKFTKSKHVVGAPIKGAAESEEWEQQLLKSKEQLEAKSRIYERMQIGSLEDEENEDGETTYLVDFHKKAIADEELKDVLQKDDWVEFTDSFGRQRRCQRKDLSKFRELDPSLTVEGDRVSTSALLADAEATHLKEMHQQWDMDEESLRQNLEGPVHYENVKFDEKRQLGVGYYQFSKNEESRQEQMQLLNNLRKETLDQRTRQDKLKDRRKELMDARLAKIKQKRALKLGKCTTQPETESKDPIKSVESEADVVDVIVPSASDGSATEGQESQPTDRETVPGKSSSSIYIEDRRNERWNEFAPPTAYQDKVDATDINNDKRSLSRADNAISEEIDDFLSQCRSK